MSGPRPEGAGDPTGSLVGRDFWEERNRGIRLASLLPRPDRDYLDFELDRFFRRRLGPGWGRILLEAGCGASLWMPYFARRLGWRVAGLDYSETGLAASREILARNGVAADLRRADLREGPGEDRGRYDAVFSLGLLEHFERPDLVLSVLSEFLRPGGLLLTWIPNTRGLVSSLNARLDERYRGLYGPLDLPSLLDHHEALGLEILQGSYVQLLDFGLLSREFVPVPLRRPFGWAVRAWGLAWMALETVLGRSIQSPRLCSGAVVAARRRA